MQMQTLTVAAPAWPAPLHVTLAIHATTRLAPRRHAALPICLPLPAATACTLVLPHAEVLEAQLVLPICAVGSRCRWRLGRSICMCRPTAGALPQPAACIAALPRLPVDG